MAKVIRTFLPAKKYHRYRIEVYRGGVMWQFEGDTRRTKWRANRYAKYRARLLDQRYRVVDTRED